MKTAEIQFTPKIRPRAVARASANPASIASLADCIKDARLAALDNDPGPSVARRGVGQGSVNGIAISNPNFMRPGPTLRKVS